MGPNTRLAGGTPAKWCRVGRQPAVALIRETVMGAPRPVALRRARELVPIWGNAMAGRPAEIRQRDVNNIIRAAKKQGATEVEIRIRGVPVIIQLSMNDENSERNAAA